MTKEHITILLSIRSRVAQKNESKPDKPYGHKIAELTFETSGIIKTTQGPEKELIKEITYVDPYNENVTLWTELVEAYAKHRPCNIILKFPKGVRYINKARGLINADINNTPPQIIDIIDPVTQVSKLPKSDPKQALFTFGNG
jgi:hypothetical protein|tara:strand:- start:742 stop:1170 length:429 start_codon:yes stop_codon:yes gene_type:complete